MRRIFAQDGEFHAFVIELQAGPPASYTFRSDFGEFPDSLNEWTSMEPNKRLDDFRKHKDEYFVSGAHSPLDPADQEGFEGLAYFAYDPALQFELDIDANGDQG